MNNKFPTNPLLPEGLLQWRDSLPEKPDPVHLRGKHVYLEPLDLERDLTTLYVRSNGTPATMGERSIDAYDADQLVWRYMSGGPFNKPQHLGEWLSKQINAPNGLALCVFDRATESQVGVLNMMANVPQHLSCELGNIWYSPLVQGTAANTEATYLMLKHIFALGYRRVVWKCDSLNGRSMKAAERLGFTFEGIHKHHYIVKDRSRDTAWFRMLDSDWRDIRPNLEMVLAGSAGVS